MADGTLSVQRPSLEQVPADDGSIQAAFEMLDAQMNAWLAAMTRAEQAVRAAARARPPQPAEKSNSHEQNDADRTADPGPSNTGTKVCVTGSLPAAVDQEETGAIGNLSADPCARIDDERQESFTTASESATANTDPIEAATDATSADAVQGIAPLDPAAARRAEDEALLATLDEATAKAIRVMRRMCMNQKSVKELLAEYQAKKDSPPAAASTKKSWFRRGK